jgi:hypothetical protein
MLMVGLGYWYIKVKQLNLLNRQFEKGAEFGVSMDSSNPKAVKYESHHYGNGVKINVTLFISFSSGNYR